MKEGRKRAVRPHYQIAVPTDFSPASTTALKFAQHLARAPGTKVTAVHTIDSLEYSFGPNDLRQIKKEQMWALAQESMARWLQEAGVSSCGQSMTEGEAAPAIAEFIAANGIDLIVLSTSARLRAARSCPARRSDSYAHPLPRCRAWKSGAASHRSTTCAHPRPFDS